jgi:hypothetical protein
MSKRSFDQFSTQDSSSLSQVLDHAEKLLKAAQNLKRDLEGLQSRSRPAGDAQQVLKQHNVQLGKVIRLLGQDEVRSNL